jgi:hypothetical protein
MEQDDELHPNPIMYLGGEVLNKIKAIIVPNPEDSAYQVARRITDACFAGSNNPAKELLREGISLGVYKMFDELIGSLHKR